jgi:hypothetical protein
MNELVHAFIMFFKYHSVEHFFLSVWCIEFEARAEMFPFNTPHTKEEMFYRMIFEKHYKGMDKFVHVWEGGCRAGGAPW